MLPVPLAAVLGGEDQLTNIVTRVYETIVGGFHERAVYSFTKAQTAVEAASAGKLAAVAASAAAVAGGGYATVERTIPHRAASKPAKVSQQPAALPRASRRRRPPRRRRRQYARPRQKQVPRRTVNEFAGAGSATRAALA